MSILGIELLIMRGALDLNSGDPGSSLGVAHETNA
jgi:hypothetical protein